MVVARQGKQMTDQWEMFDLASSFQQFLNHQRGVGPKNGSWVPQEASDIFVIVQTDTKSLPHDNMNYGFQQFFQVSEVSSLQILHIQTPHLHPSP